MATVPKPNYEDEFATKDTHRPKDTDTYIADYRQSMIPATPKRTK